MACGRWLVHGGSRVCGVPQCEVTRAAGKERSPHALRFPSQWNCGTISVVLLSARARARVCAREYLWSRSLQFSFPHQGSAICRNIALDIVGLLKTPSFLVYGRGQVSCYCNACTSEIPSLEAIVSYLTSSPPKWVPKTRREIVCTQSCAPKTKHGYLQSRSGL